MKTRTKAFWIVLAFLFAFIVYTVYYYSIQGWQWDSLFEYVLPVGGLIGGFGGIMTIAETIGKFFGSENKKTAAKKKGTEK